jgi:hypothetical protein
VAVRLRRLTPAKLGKRRMRGEVASCVWVHLFPYHHLLNVKHDNPSLLCLDIADESLAMEVAGVVLGAIPVTIYALDRYQDICEKTRAIRHWKETIGTLKCDIFLQKEQLSVTLRNAGIELRDQTTTADIEDVLRSTHPTQCDDIIHILQNMNNMMDGIAKNLIPDIQGPVSSSFCSPSGLHSRKSLDDEFI